MNPVITRRGTLILAGAACLSRATAAWARRIFRVGVVWNSRPQPDIDRGESLLRVARQLEAGLRERGWIHGQNIELISKTAEMDYSRFPGIIDSLVALPVDVLVVFGNESAKLARARTKTIPIVSAGGYVGTANPRPTGNFTGVSYIGTAPPLKRLELLKTLAPKISTVAMFARVAPGSDPPRLGQHHHDGAKAMGLRLFAVYFDRADELDVAYPNARRQGADAIYMSGFPLLTWSEPVQRQVVDAATRHSLPVVYELPDLARAGGLLAYGVDEAEGARRAPYYIDRILRGAKPSDLPIEQINKSYLNINKRAARSLGLTIPAALMLQADNVYE